MREHGGSNRAGRELTTGYSQSSSHAAEPLRHRTADEEAAARVSFFRSRAEATAEDVAKLAHTAVLEEWRQEKGRIEESRRQLVDIQAACEKDASVSEHARADLNAAKLALARIAHELASAREPRPKPLIASELEIESKIVDRSAHPDDVLAWVAGLGATHRAALADRLADARTHKTTDRDAFAIELANYLADARMLKAFQRVVADPSHFRSAAYEANRAARDTATATTSSPATSHTGGVQHAAVMTSAASPTIDASAGAHTFSVPALDEKATAEDDHEPVDVMLRRMIEQGEPDPIAIAALDGSTRRELARRLEHYRPGSGDELAARFVRHDHATRVRLLGALRSAQTTPVTKPDGDAKDGKATAPVTDAIAPLNAPPAATKQPKSEPEALHAKIGELAAQRMAELPHDGTEPKVVLEAKRALARVLERELSGELEHGVDLTIALAEDSAMIERGEIAMEIRIAPNDWRTVLAVVGAFAVFGGGVALWRWHSQRTQTGEDVEHRPAKAPKNGDTGVSTSPSTGKDGASIDKDALLASASKDKDSASASKDKDSASKDTDSTSKDKEAQPALGALPGAQIRGMPRPPYGNECFIISAMQVLASVYPDRLTAERDIDRYCRQVLQLTGDASVERVAALRNELRAHVDGEVGAIADRLNVPALQRQAAIGHLNTALAHLAQHRIVLANVRSLVERINGARPEAPMTAADTLQLRGQLHALGVVNALHGQDDASDALSRMIAEFVAGDNGANRMVVRERLTVQASTPQQPGDRNVPADPAYRPNEHGVYEREHAGETMWQVPIAQYNGLVDFLAREFGDQGVVDNFAHGSQWARMHDGSAQSVTQQKRQYKFVQLPRNVTFTLLRYAVDGAKITKEFDMPGEVTLREEGPPAALKKYKLKTIIYHQGARAGGGHYWAHRRDGDNWSRANDAHVTPDYAEARNGEGGLAHDAKQGYVYTYEQIDAPDQLGDAEQARGTPLDTDHLAQDPLGGRRPNAGALGSAVVDKSKQTSAPTSSPDPSAKKGTSTGPKSLLKGVPPALSGGDGTPIPKHGPPGRTGSDEKPLEAEEIVKLIGEHPELGARPNPDSSTSVLVADPRQPGRAIVVEIRAFPIADDTLDPIYVGAGTQGPAIFVARLGNLSDAHAWLAMAFARIRQAGYAGMKYVTAPTPTGEEPAPPPGARAITDRVKRDKSDDRRADSLGATLAFWLPSAFNPKDARFTEVTAEYAAQLFMTPSAAATMVEGLAELWLRFNPSIIAAAHPELTSGDAGKDAHKPKVDLAALLLDHLYSVLPGMVERKRDFLEQRVARAKVIPQGEQVKKSGATTTTTSGGATNTTGDGKSATSKQASTDDGTFDLAALQEVIGTIVFDEPTAQAISAERQAQLDNHLDPDYLNDEWALPMHQLLRTNAGKTPYKEFHGMLEGTGKRMAGFVRKLVDAQKDPNKLYTLDPVGKGKKQAQAQSQAQPTVGSATAMQATPDVDVDVDDNVDVTTEAEPEKSTDIAVVFANVRQEHRETVYAMMRAMGLKFTEPGQAAPPPRQRRQLRSLPTKADIRDAVEVNFISNADAEMLENILGFHTASKIISYYRLNNAIVDIQEMVRQYRKAYGMLTTSQWPTVTDKSLILDTNVAKALMSDPSVLSPEETVTREGIEHMLEHLAPTDIRLPNHVVGELHAFGADPFTVGKNATAAKWPKLEWYGVPVEGAKDKADRKGTYAEDLLKMETAMVGGAKGAPDRAIVADSLHAQKQSGATGRFVTGDKGIYGHLQKSMTDKPIPMQKDAGDIDYYETQELSESMRIYPIDIDARMKAKASAASTVATTPPSSPVIGSVPVVRPPLDLDSVHSPGGIGDPLFSQHLAKDDKSPIVSQLIALIEHAGGQVVIAGGAVRDVVRGKVPNDVDLTCTLTLRELNAALDGNDRFRGIARTEVNQPRLQLIKLNKDDKERAIDISCRAETEKKELDGKGIEQDAGKRDFRMNALYLKPDGALVDPTGNGVADALLNELVIVADHFFGDIVKSAHAPYEEIGRTFKFAARGYKISPEQLKLVQDAFVQLLQRARDKDAEGIAELAGLLDKAREAPPVQIMETMRKLGFSEPAIRALFPDGPAGRSADHQVAWDRSVVPRRLENPENERIDTNAAPEPKIDEERGRIYQYRVLAKTPEPVTDVMIDVDMTNHDMPGHSAPHYHVFLWDGQEWDDKNCGFSSTGQPGYPEVDGGIYRGPRPWLFSAGLDQKQDTKTLVEEVNKNLRKCGGTYEATAHGDMIDLGGELEIHVAKVKELLASSRLTLLLMLVNNVVDRGKLPMREDHAVKELTTSTGERLRFKKQLEEIGYLIADLALGDNPLFAKLGDDLDGRLRMFDLLFLWRTQANAVRRASARAVKKPPKSIAEYVELTEAYLAVDGEHDDGAAKKDEAADKEVDGALVAAHESRAATTAGTAITGAKRQERITAVVDCAKAGTLQFATDTALAYHFLKHGKEFNAGTVADYVRLARLAIADGKPDEGMTEQTGAEAITFDHQTPNGNDKAVVRIAPDGSASIATYFRRDPRAPERVTVLPIESIELEQTPGLAVRQSDGPVPAQIERLITALEYQAVEYEHQKPKADSVDAEQAAAAKRRFDSLGALVVHARQRIADAGESTKNAEWVRRLDVLDKLIVASEAPKTTTKST